MSLYFASNQAKQKAFDRTYRARARSNFVQGRKLRALIEKENADEALTDQLAGLYTKSVAKVREYDYDRINGLQKRAPEVIIPDEEGDAPSAPKVKRGVPLPKRKKQVPRPAIPRNQSPPHSPPAPPSAPPAAPRSAPARRTWTQESTDAHFSVHPNIPSPPSPSSSASSGESAVDMFLSDPDTREFYATLRRNYNMSRSDRAPIKRKVVNAEINQYIKRYQREAKDRQLFDRRMTKVQAAQVRDNIAKSVMNPESSFTDVVMSPVTMTRQRDQETESPPSSRRSGSSSSEEYDEEFKRGLEEEQKAAEDHPRLRGDYTRFISDLVKRDRNNRKNNSGYQGYVYERARDEFKDMVDAANGDGYWKEHSPKPYKRSDGKRGADTDETVGKYKERLIGWLNGVFPDRSVRS